MPDEFEAEKEVSLESAVAGYLCTAQAMGRYSQSSIINRRYELQRFCHFCSVHHVIMVSDVRKDLIIHYLDSLNIKNASKRTILQTLIAFMDYLVDQAFVLDNLAASIPPPKTESRAPDLLAYEELEKLFQSENLEAPPKCVERNLLLLTLFRILLLRASEAVNLKMTDVNLMKHRRIMSLSALSLLMLILIFVQSCRSLTPSAEIKGASEVSSLVKITFLQMNDVYEITPVAKAQGGLARVSTLKKRLLQKNPNTFTVQAGDLFSPSALAQQNLTGSLWIVDKSSM
jgi:integrase